METWFIIVVSLCVAALIRSLLFRRSDADGKKLPPGPSLISSNFILLTNSLSELEPILRKFKSKYGPLITLSIGSRPSIFVGNHSLAHQVLIQKGAVFSDRPRTLAVRNISSSAYGPTWRVLRRNLASEVLHPSRVKSYSWARKWVLQILLGRLREQKEAAGIKRRLLLLVGSGRFNVLGIFPRLGKILFRNRWKQLLQIREDQEQVLIPHIKSRIESANSEPQSVGDERIVAYVDTLVNIQLPEEEANNENGGKLTQKEMVSMCGEFLNAGTDTTSTALQWIMANLVKHPEIQSKLYNEIISVVGPPPPPPPPGVELESVINEEDLKKMPYLKAVVLEALRRHPPGHFVLPHRVTKEMEVQGFTIPQGATINFMVAEMGLDPTVWDNPMEFKPERFINGDFDITGSKGIKMMPFGAGRRICPGSDLALLHLEYFVANLIWYFHWSPPDGCHVDLSEKVEFTIVMKKPLQARVSSRTENATS
ncbi:unnamed protein product [Lactuca saligna]|uniref:Cytochrome P450 n=1 Tax=Lactuca saligna TaxID=75948 RepID=A0AA35YRJ3_LACSI|nr:unnamed protein product [Lactuca saligna]